MTTQRRSPRRSFRRSGRRSKTSWLQSAFEFLISAATGPILFSDLTPPPMRDAASNTEGTATIKRLILNGSISSESAQIQPQVIDIGIYVLGHEAFDAPALNDPTADEGQDWYYWTQVQALPDAFRLEKFNADIRTSRRLRAGSKLAIVVNNPSQEAVLHMTFSSRALWTQEL